MSKVYGIILAGGFGARLNNSTPKQFLELQKRPIITWSLEKFEKLSEIDEIIVVIPIKFKNKINEIALKYGISKLKNIINGGKTRQGSSYNALQCMEFKKDDILVFHDAARPFIKEETIIKCIEETKRHGGAGVYLKATDTITEVEKGFVNNIPNRSKMYYTQTPQTFKYEIINKAHELAVSEKITDATDDVQLVRNAGFNIKIVDGDKSNIKITEPLDLELAQFIITQLD